MPTLSTRFARLNGRAKTLLAAAGTVLSVVLVAGGLLAFDPPLRTRVLRALPGLTINGCEIKPGAQCPNADLSNANLAGAELGGANLENANLIYADLSGANLSGAI